jgi:hypothetical protein
MPLALSPPPAPPRPGTIPPMAGLNTHGFHPPPCESYQRHHQHRSSKSCGNAQPSPLTLEGTECVKLQYCSCSSSIPGKGEDLSLQELSLYFHLQFLELARFPDSLLQHLTQEWAQTSLHHNPWVSRIKNVALIHCVTKTCVLLQFPSFSCNKENTDDTQPALSELGLHTEKEEIVNTPKTPT